MNLLFELGAFEFASEESIEKMLFEDSSLY